MSNTEQRTQNPMGRSGLNLNTNQGVSKPSQFSRLPETLQTILNEVKKLEKKANLLYFQSKYDEAEKLYKLAIKAYGSNKKEAVECIYNLARICHKQQKFAEAETHYNDTYLISVNLPEKAHLQDLVTRNLAELYRDINNSFKEESILLKMISMHSNSKTEEDINYVRNSLYKLLDIYTNANRHTEAYKVSQELKKIEARYLSTIL